MNDPAPSGSSKPGPAARKVPCPGCGDPAPWEGNPWRPFCSERCKLGDLGAWASGDYAIPSEDSPENGGPDGESDGEGQ